MRSSSRVMEVTGPNDTAFDYTQNVGYSNGCGTGASPASEA